MCKTLTMLRDVTFEYMCGVDGFALYYAVVTSDAVPYQDAATLLRCSSFSTTNSLHPEIRPEESRMVLFLEKVNRIRVA